MEKHLNRKLPPISKLVIILRCLVLRRNLNGELGICIFYHAVMIYMAGYGSKAEDQINKK